MMITITLNKIKANDPCPDGWKKIKKAMEPKYGMDNPFPLADALESNGSEDVIWALRCLPEYDNLWRKYAVWCARQVEHLMKDKRSRDALDVAWRHSEGKATDDELTAAWDAAGATGVTGAAAAAAEATGVTGAAEATQEAKLKQILDAGKWVDDTSN